MSVYYNICEYFGYPEPWKNYMDNYIYIDKGRYAPWTCKYYIISSGFKALIAFGMV
jgi:hypothetical protein